jgi:2-oxoglutarate dehydrogenase E2 component (dihydrolipoamide succinyltransferase)
MSTIPVPLPELGESVVEGTIARWLVKEGERVERDQPLVEVTTDKVDAEIPAPEAGVVVALLAQEGETVAVGAEIARIDTEARPRAAAQPEPPAAPEPAREAEPPARGPQPLERREAPERRVTPMARRLAEETGVDLREVQGSGVSGRVMRADVEDQARSRAARPVSGPRAPSEPAAAASEGRAAPATPAYGDLLERGRSQFSQYSLQEGDRVIPMSPLRKIVAEHMVYSKLTSPHVGTVAEVDMQHVVRLRQAHKRAFEESQGFSLTFLPFVVHATVRALREFPALNASVMEDAIVEKRDIHVGIAVETEKGLVVPVVRHADRLSLAGLAAAVEELSARARSKRLSADELKGGTFTVSNPGRHGNLYGFAIINQPQVGIVRMGEIVKRPVVREVDGDDVIVIRPIMYLALSYDHRAVDGAPANGFLHRVKVLLEEGEFDL